MGDSLTEGLGVENERNYPSQLERALHKKGLHWNVSNAGLSGELSQGARARLAWVLKLKPDAVLLETGANDGLRGINPKVTEENLLAILTELQQRKVPVMLAGMRTLTNMGADYAGKFQAIYPRVAERMKVPLIPFFLEGVGGVSRLNQEDKIHPTAEGYAIIVAAIAPQVAAWLSSL